MLPAPKRPPNGDDSQTRPVLIEEDETLTRVCWSDSLDSDEETHLFETRRMRRKDAAAFALPPPGAPPQRRPPRASPAKPQLSVRMPVRPPVHVRPSLPSVPPPPSQPVLWRIPDEPQVGDTPVPHSSGVRASRAREAPIQIPDADVPPPSRPSRTVPPPAPSRAARAAATQLVVSTPGAETAAVTTVAPPVAARASVPQEPLVQLQHTEPRMFHQPVASPIPEGWSDCWVAAPSSVPPPTVRHLSVPPHPLASPPAWMRSALPALVCFLSLLTGLAIAFVVFLGWAPPAIAVSSAAESARSVSDRAYDAWDDAQEVDDDKAAPAETPAEKSAASSEPAARPAPPRAFAQAPRAKAAQKEKEKASEKKAKAKEEPEPEAKASGPGGTININSLPSSKAILDGRPVGNTPVMGLPVDAGPHTVTFVHPKYGKASVSVRVSPGQTAVAAHRFPFRRGE
jgi:hypothetical protein